ncbi:MAG: hypothetical protein IJS01_01475 [Lentisphaeria bacterium]|nr:hypothetical protein [Lentisphaeria bacterium]
MFRLFFERGKFFIAVCCLFLLLSCGDSSGWKLESDFLKYEKTDALSYQGRYSEAKRQLEKLAGEDNPWAIWSLRCSFEFSEADRKKMSERAIQLGIPYRPQKEQSIQRWKEILKKGHDPYFRASACKALAILERDKMKKYCDRGLEILKNAPETVNVLQLRDTLRRRFDVTPGRVHPEHPRICELAPGLIGIYVNHWIGRYANGKISRRPLNSQELALLRKHEDFLRRTVSAGETAGFYALGKLLLGFCDYPGRRLDEGVRYLERAAEEQQNVSAGILLARFYSGCLDSPLAAEVFSPNPPETFDPKKADYWIQWCGKRKVSVSWLEHLKNYSAQERAAKKTRK